MQNRIKLFGLSLVAMPLLSWASITSGPYIGVGIVQQNIVLDLDTTLSQDLAFTGTPQVQEILHNKIAINDYEDKLAFQGNVYVGYQYAASFFMGAVELEYMYDWLRTIISKEDRFDFVPHPEILDHVILTAMDGFSASLLLGISPQCRKIAFYLRAGYQMQNFQSQAAEGGILGASGKFQRGLNGYLAGLGMQAEFCEGFGMRLEYRYVNYAKGFSRDTVSAKWTIPEVPPFSDIPAYVHAHYKSVIDNQFTLSVNYVFNCAYW